MSKEKRRKYTEEFRQEAVNLVTEQGYKVPEAARNLGINASMLRRWVRNYSSNGIETTQLSSALTEERRRIRELEAENKRLKMEREILKNATAFFVKESS